LLAEVDVFLCKGSIFKTGSFLSTLKLPPLVYRVKNKNIENTAGHIKHIKILILPVLGRKYFFTTVFEDILFILKLRRTTDFWIPVPNKTNFSELLSPFTKHKYAGENLSSIVSFTVRHAGIELSPAPYVTDYSGTGSAQL
jgi:hypothetical protein